ncbi:MAG: hypothetical protein J6E42_06425 [Firmicutes bacterium]|nr:hypothetical protein [Bacillota bacterium]
MADKKSFLLYFDMYPMIRDLPAEQRGYLLSAMFEYADAAWRSTVDAESILQKFPRMGKAARMAYAFIAAAIYRDTKKWLEKQARYHQAAVARCENAHRKEMDSIKQYF